MSYRDMCGVKLLMNYGWVSSEHTMLYTSQCQSIYIDMQTIRDLFGRW